MGGVCVRVLTRPVWQVGSHGGLTLKLATLGHHSEHVVLVGVQELKVIAVAGQATPPAER